MTDRKPHLTLVDGGRAQPAERIALSLVVHERKCLNIPLQAVLGIDAVPTLTIYDGRETVTYDMPRVEIHLTPSMRQKLRDFTKDIVGLPMEIHIRDCCVLRPVLREPLGMAPTFSITAYDSSEAQALADLLRDGWRPLRAVE